MKDYKLLLAANVTGKDLTPGKFRYFVDLKQGAFIYAFPAEHQPPEGWPLVELPADTVEELLTSEYE